MFYNLKKDFSQEERRVLLKDLCSIFRISDLNTKKIMAALDNDKFFNFEDCLQEQCVVEEVADYVKVQTVSIFSWRQCDNSILIQNIAYVLLKQPDILPKAHRCQKHNGQYHIS